LPGLSRPCDRTTINGWEDVVQGRRSGTNGRREELINGRTYDRGMPDLLWSSDARGLEPTGRRRVADIAGRRKDGLDRIAQAAANDQRCPGRV